MNILLELVFNLGILVSISIISGFIGQRGNKNWYSEPLQGLLFGSAAVIGMLHPLVVAPGLIFDGRSVMISLAGLFFGPIAATIAGIMALVARLQQGGEGATLGVLIIIMSAFVGAFLYTRNKKNDRKETLRQLMSMGIIVHVTMILEELVAAEEQLRSQFEELQMNSILIKASEYTRLDNYLKAPPMQYL